MSIASIYSHTSKFIGNSKVRRSCDGSDRKEVTDSDIGIYSPNIPSHVTLILIPNQSAA